MLLAFIYNPLQTCVTYLALSLYILCGYVFIWSFKLHISYARSSGKTASDILRFRTRSCLYQIARNSDSNTDNKNKIKPFYVYMSIILISQALPLIVIYFSGVILYILTLGSLNDFEAIQSLVPPLLIGVFTYFVLKPTYRQVKQKINLQDDNIMEKLIKKHREENPTNI